jgi:hypothetical protein
LRPIILTGWLIYLEGLRKINQDTKCLSQYSVQVLPKHRPDTLLWN